MANGYGKGTIGANNSPHPQGPNLGPVRYAPYQDKVSYGKVGKTTGADGRPVSSMTLKPENKGVNANTRTAVNNGYSGEFAKGKALAENRQSPTTGKASGPLK